MGLNKFETTCIIDDDPIFIYGTKRLMKEVDFCDTVLVYNNGQQALEGLAHISSEGKKLPKVIFLDLNMPIMNGWEFLEDFVKIPNNDHQDIIIYIISSSVDPRDLERVQHYEMVNNYILKPITPSDLENLLAEAAQY